MPSEPNFKCTWEELDTGFQTKFWGDIQELIRYNIASMHEENEKDTLDLSQTSVIRGRIAMGRFILDSLAWIENVKTLFDEPDEEIDNE